MAPALERFDHIHVYTPDRAAAEKWYARVMGFTRVQDLAFWAPDGGPLTLGDASGTIHLALFERPAEKCRSTIALAATAAQFLEWRAHLGDALGRTIDAVDHGVSWSLYFSDPDGNPYEITSYEYEALSARLKR
jgi:catechol 2,3-dioxygenase-like lactoylglutathione lyase family enzyme